MSRAAEFPLERDVLITVKAYPNPSQKYRETVCVAGVTRDEGWIRLYPVTFRHLPGDQRFKYRYFCDDPHCKNGHEQTIVDWEACELYRKLRDSEGSEQAIHAKMREKFVDELWGPGKDSYLFVGNQRVHQRSFIVLGVFWPPKAKDTRQMRLL